MFSKLLDVLFPPSAHERRIRKITHLKPEPVTIRIADNVEVLTCARFNTPEVKSALKALKKSGDTHAAKLLATLLSDVLLEELADHALWNSQRVLLMPIPSSKSRVRERGFNHLERVLEHLPTELRERCVHDVLTQTRTTTMQKTLSKNERIENVKDAFTIQNKEKLENTHVILIDDVYTTGATLTEALNTLRSTDIHATAITLARA